MNLFCYILSLKIVARLEEPEAPCFVKNASTSGSSKSQVLSSLLSLPASFFKVIPLPQKFDSKMGHLKKGDNEMGYAKWLRKKMCFPNWSAKLKLLYCST